MKESISTCIFFRTRTRGTGRGREVQEDKEDVKRKENRTQET